MPDTPTPRTWRTGEVADRLGLDPHVFSTWAGRHRFPCTYPSHGSGLYRRFTEDDIVRIAILVQVIKIDGGGGNRVSALAERLAAYDRLPPWLLVIEAETVVPAWSDTEMLAAIAAVATGTAVLLVSTEVLSQAVTNSTAVEKELIAV